MLEFEGPVGHTKELESNSSTSTVVPSSIMKPEGYSSDRNQESTYNDTEEANPGMSKAGAVSVLKKSNQKPTQLLSATVRKKTDSSCKDLLSVQAMQDVLEAVRAENEMVDDFVVSLKENMAAIAALRTGHADSIAPSTDSAAPKTDSGAPRTGRKSIEGLVHTEQRGGLVTPTSWLTAEDGESRIEKPVDSNSPRVWGNGDSTTSSPLVSPAGGSRDQREDASSLQPCSEAGGSLIKPVLLNYSTSKPSSRHHLKPTSTTLKSELGHTPNLESVAVTVSGGVAMKGEGMASQSLTEHTLKVITEKVRIMNSK